MVNIITDNLLTMKEIRIRFNDNVKTKIDQL